MHQKAVMVGDKAAGSAILQSSNAMEIRDLGCQVANFVESFGLEIRQAIVTPGHYLKFTTSDKLSGGQTLKELLMETGYKIPIEAAPKNRNWGIGSSATRRLITGVAGVISVTRNIFGPKPHMWRDVGFWG